MTNDLQVAGIQAKRAQDQLTEALDNRDRLIREALDGGATLRAVAQQAGISHTAVANIANRK
jgi:hypothetical protein